MMKCDVCGNEYDKAFTVTSGARTYTFDSFECAINKLAPTCAHCGCKVIGHGAATGGAACEVRLWDLTESRLVRRFGPLAGPVLSAAFSPDGRQLAAILWAPNLVHVWDVATGDLLLQTQGPEREARGQCVA